VARKLTEIEKERLGAKMSVVANFTCQYLALRT